LTGCARRTTPAAPSHRLDIRPLNARAEFIDGAVSRHDRAGSELERFGSVYLAAKTYEGWRFTTIVFTAAQRVHPG